jgi:hypothetical protein
MDNTNVDLPNILSESEYVLNNINITEADVVDLLNTLDISKAIGPDGISPRILKERASILRYPLYKIFNISLRSGVLIILLLLNQTLLICLIFLIYLKLLDPTVLAPAFLRKERQF